MRIVSATWSCPAPSPTAPANSGRRWIGARFRLRRERCLPAVHGARPNLRRMPLRPRDRGRRPLHRPASSPTRPAVFSVLRDVTGMAGRFPANCHRGCVSRFGLLSLGNIVSRRFLRGRGGDPEREKHGFLHDCTNGAFERIQPPFRRRHAAVGGCARVYGRRKRVSRDAFRHARGSSPHGRSCTRLRWTRISARIPETTQRVGPPWLGHGVRPPWSGKPGSV